MSNHRKVWSQEEKLSVISFYNEKGLGATSREFNVSSTSINNWLDTFAKYGAKGLEKGGVKTDSEKEIQRLLRENKELKEMIAERELALRIKDALLKKKH